MHELEQRPNKLHYPYISILGHPDYYRRFGIYPLVNLTLNHSIHYHIKLLCLKYCCQKRLKIWAERFITQQFLSDVF